MIFCPNLRGLTLFENDEVVSHGQLGEFSDVFEGQFDFLTCLNGKLLDVELHGIIARNSDLLIGVQKSGRGDRENKTG